MLIYLAIDIRQYVIMHTHEQVKLCGNVYLKNYTVIILYHDDDEIQQAPGIRKVGFVAKRHPFDQHLQDEYSDEKFVQIIQDFF